MLNLIKSRILDSAEKRRVLSNIFSLGMLQGASYLLPLITFPYLVRVLGMENFGTLSFATAIIAYFIAVTDYGFNLSATKNVSVSRGNQQEINRIFSSVMTIKLLLTMACFLVLIVLMLTVDRLKNDWFIFLLTFGMVLGQAMFPIWLFQGMERMKYITYIHIFAKIFFTACIFLFVKDEAHLYLVPLFNSLGFIIAGGISIWLAIKMFGVSYSIQSKDSLVEQVFNGWHIFYSRVFVNLYSTTNIVLLGFFTNNTVVGHYAVAEKIIQALLGIFQPVLQAVFPYMANVYKENRNRFLLLFKKINASILFVSVIMTFFTVMLAPWLVSVVSGGESHEVSLILMILGLSILLDPYGPSYTNGLVILGESNCLVSVVKKTFAFNMILVIPLILLYGAMGVAVLTFLRTIYHFFVISRSFKAAVHTA